MPAAIPPLKRHFRARRTSNPPVADHVDSPPPGTDPDLLLRAQAGDEEAFGALMRTHHDATFRLVYSIVRDEHDARDASQEVWLTVWRELKKFRGDSKFTTWLHSVAVRRSVDFLRKRRRWYSRFLPFLSNQENTSDHDDPRLATGDHPRHALEHSERSAQIDAALAALPPKHRAILALREIQGLSYEEIAQTLDCRTGTVMSRLFKARRLLAQKLKDLPCE